MRPARSFPPNNGSTYRPRPRSTSVPPPHTGTFTPNRISTIADNAARSGDSFGQTSRTLPPLMLGPDGRRSVPFRLPPGPPPMRYSNRASMDSYYDGETVETREPFPGQEVRRLSPAELKFYSVRFDRGILRGRRDLPFETSNGTAAFGRDPRAIFVMNEHGDIFASNSPEPGEFHHSTLGNGRPVAAAGELSVKDGRINFVTAASGHYKPQRAQMMNLKFELERQGILGVPIFDHRGPNSGSPPMYVTGEM